MKQLDEWFYEYEKSHKHPTNIWIHKVCVPLIFLSFLGILWFLKLPFPFIPNFGVVALIPLMIFYFYLSKAYFLGMLLQVFIDLRIIIYLEQYNPTFLLWISLITFAIACVFQFIGHKIEGKKPSFLEDLVFLFIGPLWVLKFLY